MTGFFIGGILLGTGLAMDAFSVSLANGLNEPDMPAGKAVATAGVFAGFQTLMPMIGWICVRSAAETFGLFAGYIPIISFLVLGLIGVDMIREGFKKKNGAEELPASGFASLMVQGTATSIDALSVGFTIAEYDFLYALIKSVIVGAVTFLICLGGLRIGRRFGTKLSYKASVLGGIILISIGMEILVKSLLNNP